MATRTERRVAYRGLVTAIGNAAAVDGFMERVAIAKAMDALGSIISDVGPGVMTEAIALRNGPLLRDHQPVSEYLRKDPEPIKWVFTPEAVLELPLGVGPNLIEEAYRRAEKAMPTALIGFHGDESGPYGDVACNREGCFVVTLYPSQDYCAEYAGVPEPKTPEGLLPTILIEFEWLLGWPDCSETVELQIIDNAKQILHDTKPDKHAKLTDSWWAKVEVTDIGYLVTFHYDTEFRQEN